MYTIDEVSEIITSLKEAYKRAIASNGVTQYSINSGQGSSSVKSASLAEITAELNKWQQIYDDMLAAETGSNFTFIRGFGY